MKRLKIENGPIYSLIDFFTEKQFRGVIRAQSNVCDERIFEKMSSIVDIWLGSKYASTVI